MRGNRIRVDQLLDVLGEHVHLDSHLIASRETAEGRLLEGVQDEGDLKVPSEALRS